MQNCYFRLITLSLTISYVWTFSPTCSDDYDSNAYNDLYTIENHLSCVQESLPSSQIRLGSAGLSTYNENIIWKVKMSKDFNADNPVVWIDCGMQARDWITHSTCIHIIDTIKSHLLGEKQQGKDALIEEMLENYDVLIIPVVNPDGYSYSRITNSSSIYSTYANKEWRKNVVPVTSEDSQEECIGVFISQNFDASFDTNDVNECNDTYNGKNANSEKESQVLAKLLEEVSLEGIVAVFHMEESGSTWMYPYANSNEEPEEISLTCLKNACQSGVDTILEANPDANYECDQASAFYEETKGGTFLDYVYDLYTATVPVFCLALRNDDAILPGSSQIEDIAGEIFSGILSAVKTLSESDCLPQRTLNLPDLCNSRDTFDPSDFNEFEKIENHLKCIIRMLPSDRLNSTGKSADGGRNIWQISFDSYSEDPVGTVWIDCGMQGRDWITVSTCMFLIDAVSNHKQGIQFDRDIQSLLDYFNIQIIPVVNPDGYVESWTEFNRNWIKNTQVVDGNICDGIFISQNFAFKFESNYSNTQQCDHDYIGPAAELAVEIGAIISALDNSLRDMQTMYVFHLESVGHTWMYPHYYVVDEPLDIVMMDELCQIGVESIGRALTGNKYKCGQAAVLDQERGGTFIDYVYNILDIKVVYSLAPSSSADVLPEEIGNTGMDILQGIQSVMYYIREQYIGNGTTTTPSSTASSTTPASTTTTVKPIPTTPGLPGP